MIIIIRLERPDNQASKVATRRFRSMHNSVQILLECVTGARIGELAGAQVGQGVFANHYSIVEWKGKHTSASGEVT